MSLSIDFSQHHFCLPHRSVYSRDAFPALFCSKWFTSTAFFLLDTVKAVKGKFITDEAPVPPSKAILLLRDFLLESVKWVDEFPPITQNQRFGNQAFRQWHRKVVQQSLSLCKGLVALSPILPAKVRIRRFD